MGSRHPGQGLPGVFTARVAARVRAAGHRRVSRRASHPRSQRSKPGRSPVSPRPLGGGRRRSGRPDRCAGAHAERPPVARRHDRKSPARASRIKTPPHRAARLIAALLDKGIDPSSGGIDALLGMLSFGERGGADHRRYKGRRMPATARDVAEYAGGLTPSSPVPRMRCRRSITSAARRRHGSSFLSLSIPANIAFPARSRSSTTLFYPGRCGSLSACPASRSISRSRERKRSFPFFAMTSSSRAPRARDWTT